MKRIIITSLITIFVVVTTALVVNYFTGFGYYLPHKTMVIYTWESNDIFANEEPQYIAITPEVEPHGLIFRTIYEFPQLVYLYGYPYLQFKLPDGYELSSFVMPYSKENIEARYVIANKNIDGDVIINIPATNIPNISK